MFHVVQTSNNRYELRETHTHNAWAVGSVQERLMMIQRAMNEYARTHPIFPPAEAATDESGE